jgi:O-antigen chain-terminating methyltransferase
MKRLLRPVFNKMASMLGIANIYNRLDSLEKQVAPVSPSFGAFDIMERRMVDLAMASHSPLRDELASLRDELASATLNNENRLKSLNEALVTYVDAKQEQNNQTIIEITNKQSKIIAETRQSFDTIRRQVAETSITLEKPLIQSAQVVYPANIKIIDDSLYVALENHFRGSRDVVSQRQRDYLPMLPAGITSSHPLVDLGCGRGEWLQVLRQENIPAIGIDSNAVCIAECREEGLDVIHEGLLEYISQRPDASVGAYTLFQVLEHLPFPVLIETLRQMRRTLVPGGRLIAEVPNAKNLRVSAGTFWIDPTHQRPLFPELLIFLASEIGFAQSDGHYTNNLSPNHDLSGLPQGATTALQSVIDAIDGPGDFALIATA